MNMYMLPDSHVKNFIGLICFLFIAMTLFVANIMTFNIYSQPAELRTINYSSAEEVKKDKEYQIWIRPKEQSNPQPNSSTIQISGKVVALGSDPANQKKEDLPADMTISGTIKSVAAIADNKKEIVIDWDKNSFNTGSYASKFKLNMNQSITQKTVIGAFLQYKAAKNDSTRNNSAGNSATSTSASSTSSSTASRGNSLNGGSSASASSDDPLSQAGTGSSSGGGSLGGGGGGGYIPPSGGGGSGSNAPGGSNANNDNNNGTGGANNAAAPASASQSLCEPSFDFDNNQVAINARVGNEACKTITTVPMEQTRTGCNIRLDIGNELAIITEKKRYTYNGSSNDITACYDTDLKYTLQKDKGDCQNGFDADSLSIIPFFKYYYVDNSNKNYVSGCLEQAQKIPVEANRFKKEVVDYNHVFDERTSYEMLQTYVMIDGAKYNIGDSVPGRAYKQTFQRGNCVNYEVNRDNLNDVVYEHKQWGFRSADNVYHPVTDCAPDLDISYPVSLSDSNCSIEVNTVSRQYTVYKKETYTSSTGELVTITPCFETNDIKSILPSDITKDYASCADKVDINLMQVRPQYREVFQKNNQKHNLSSCKYDPNGVVWAIQKSTEGCSPIIDYISKKVYFQSQLSYNKNEKVISVSDCIRDLAIRDEEIREDSVGCIDQLSGDKKHYVHFTNKYYLVNGVERVYLQSCTTKLTKPTTPIPSNDILKDYSACKPSLNFGKDDNGAQISGTFVELHGQRLIAYYKPYVVLGYKNEYLGDCVTDNSFTEFRAILEQNACTAQANHVEGIVRPTYDVSYIDKGESILLYSCLRTEDKYTIHEEFSGCTPVSLGKGKYLKTRKFFYNDSIGNRFYLTDCEMSNDEQVAQEVICEDNRFDVDMPSRLVYYRTKMVYFETDDNGKDVEVVLIDCNRSYNKAIVTITAKTCGYLHDDVKKLSQLYVLNSFTYKGVPKKVKDPILKIEVDNIYPADATGLFLVSNVNAKEVLELGDTHIIEDQQLGNLNSVKESAALGIDADDPVSEFMDEYCVANPQAVFDYRETDTRVKEVKYNSVKYLYPTLTNDYNTTFFDTSTNTIDYTNYDISSNYPLNNIYKDFYQEPNTITDSKEGLSVFEALRKIKIRGFVFEVEWLELRMTLPMLPTGVEYDVSCQEMSIFTRINNYGGQIITEKRFNYKTNVYAHKPNNFYDAVVTPHNIAKLDPPYQTKYIGLLPINMEDIPNSLTSSDELVFTITVTDYDFVRNTRDVREAVADFSNLYKKYEEYEQEEYEQPENCSQVQVSLKSLTSVWQDTQVKFAWSDLRTTFTQTGGPQGPRRRTDRYRMAASIENSISTLDGKYTGEDSTLPILSFVEEDITEENILSTTTQ